jgi:hypothetical protein
MDATPTPPKASIGEWIAGGMIVLIAVAGGMLLVTAVQELLLPNLGVFEEIWFFLGFLPILWIAKRTGCLKGFTWRGLLFVAALVTATSAIFNLLRAPIWQLHMLQMAVLGIAVKIAQRRGWLPAEKSDAV